MPDNNPASTSPTGGDGAGEPATVRFNSLAGVRIHYARPPHAVYGSMGKGLKDQAGGPVTRACFTALEACFSDIWNACPYGPGQAIVTGGIRGHGRDRHGEGRAFDLDSLWWRGTKPIVALEYPRDKPRYLAVEAILRKHFGTVLNYNYNSAHRDHWHIDNGKPVGFRENSRAITLFVQDCLIELYGQSGLQLDGVFGAHTSEAIQSALGDGLHDLNAWFSFLSSTAAIGFAQMH